MLIKYESTGYDFLCQGMVAFCPFEEKADLCPCSYKALVLVMASISHFKKMCFKI